MIKNHVLAPRQEHSVVQDENQLISELPLDYNTAVKKVVQQASPMKNFRVLAADTDLSKLFVSGIRIKRRHIKDELHAVDPNRYFN